MNSGSLWNLLRLLIFLTVVRSVYSNGCPRDVPCQGNRNRTRNGCCPTPPYGFCGGGGPQEGQCDEGLGYTCVETSEGEEGGTCQGSFLLRVLEVTYTTVKISWTDVAPVNYSNEYIVLWTNDTELMEWKSDQFGRNPISVTLRKLEPDTLYFIRVGIWEDPERGVFLNRSEIAMAKTRAGCVLGSHWLGIGEVQIFGCEEKCVCFRTGLNCTRLCPATISVNPGESSNCSALAAGEEFPECCIEMVCTEGSCLAEDGTRYNNNDEYTTDCDFCVCQNGESRCSARYECENTNTIPCPGRRRKISLEGACCTQYECSLECEEGNVTYEHGDSVTRGCNDQCSCHNGWVQCESICPDVDLEPTSDCRYPVRMFAPGKRCAQRHCRPTQSADCVIEGVPQPVGESQYTPECRRCTCQDELSYGCNRGCFQDIEQITATSECPSPQFVQLDGECCPQIWCQKPSLDPDLKQTTVSDLKVFWVSPESLDVVFTVPKREDLKGPLLGYELFYADNVESHSPIQWRSVFLSAVTQSPLSVWNDSSTTGPSVDRYDGNNTVKINVSGLVVGQTYLIRVQLVLDWESPLGITLSDSHPNTSLSPEEIIPDQPRSPLSITVVAPPITQFKCSIKGSYLQHGEQHQDGCDVICTCSYGEISCARVCPEDRVTCPRPVQTPPPGECCGRTKCYGKPGCCPYGNTTISDGDIVREQCDKYCRCDNGTLTCWPVCSNLQPPSPKCKKLYYKDRCCPTWRCPSEQQPPFAVAVTVTLKLAGVCDEQNHDFIGELFKNVMAKFQSENLCKVEQDEDVVLCTESQITAICPKIMESRRKRHPASSVILVLVKVEALNTASAKNFTGENQLKHTLEKMKNLTSKDIIITVGDNKYPILTDIDVSDPTVVCKEGYLKHGEGCMAGHVVSSNRSVSYHVSLTATAITESTATLQWVGLPHIQLDYLKGVMLEYRDISSNGSWVSTHIVHVSRTAYDLQTLSPGTLYLVRLILLTIDPGVGRYTAASCMFQTYHLQGILPNFVRPEIIEMEVSSSAVTVRWSKLGYEQRRFVEQVFVAHKELSKTGEVFPFKRSTALASIVNQYKLHGLSADTIYTIKIGLILSNKTTVFSLAADVRTKTASAQLDSPELASHRRVVIAVSVVAFVAVAGLITLIICIFRKGRGSSRLSSSSSETNFENKMFDMDSQDNTSFEKTPP